MEKVKVILDGYDPSKTYQLFSRIINTETGLTTGYTCTSSDEYTYDRKSPDPRPVEKIEIGGDKFNNYIIKGILSYEDFPEMESSDFMWIAECGMVVIHIAATEKDFIIYDLLHVSDKNFDDIHQPKNQKTYDDIDASFRHYVIDVVDGAPQPLMISDNMFYLNVDLVEVTYADDTTSILERENITNSELPGYYDSVFVFDADKTDPVISAVYLYGGNNATHAGTIDGDVKAADTATEIIPKVNDGITVNVEYIKYTFSGTGAISLW